MRLNGKPIHELTFEDLQALIGSEVESQTIDYKRDFRRQKSDNSKIDWGDLCTDIATFANAFGGVLIFGMGESNGIANEIEGFPTPNLEELQDSMAREIKMGIEPSVPVQIKPIFHKQISGKFLIIIGINSSANKPHRVKATNKFPYRIASNKLDNLPVQELRRMFIDSMKQGKSIEEFRQARVVPIIQQGFQLLRKTEMPLIAITSIPLSTFEQYYIEMSEVNHTIFTEYGRGISHQRILHGFHNLDGYLGLGEREYAQIFRDGTIENVSKFEIAQDKNIELKQLENIIFSIVSRTLEVQKKLKIFQPTLVLISFMNVENVTFVQQDSFSSQYGGKLIDRSEIHLPNLTINEEITDYLNELPPKLKPLFNILWNISGFPGSNNFEDDGKWKGRSYYGSR